MDTFEIYAVTKQGAERKLLMSFDDLDDARIFASETIAQYEANSPAGFDLHSDVICVERVDGLGQRKTEFIV